MPLPADTLPAALPAIGSAAANGGASQPANAIVAMLAHIATTGSDAAKPGDDVADESLRVRTTSEYSVNSGAAPRAAAGRTPTLFLLLFFIRLP